MYKISYLNKFVVSFMFPYLEHVSRKHFITDIDFLKLRPVWTQSIQVTKVIGSLHLVIVHILGITKSPIIVRSKMLFLVTRLLMHVR